MAATLTQDSLSAAQVPGAKPSSVLVQRLASVDAYRGFVMLLMMDWVLSIDHIAKALPGSRFWSLMYYHGEHVEWVGCSLEDLIQPSFSFLVGVVLPFSLARRAAENQPEWRRSLHAFWRALVLIFLGVFLRSLGRPQTNWVFEDTLTQIGLGYGFLFLLAPRSLGTQWASLAVILLGYWLAFALYPLPGPGFDWVRAGTQPGAVGQLPGFAGHWSINSNFAWAFDNWFLNLFPREHPVTNNHGGYVTLSFIPTLGTMILGLIAGGVLRSERKPLDKVRWLAIAGGIGLVAGWLLGATGICPVVKRIWTPSWVLFSGGWCFLLLAGFYLVMDVWNRRSWAFVLTVVGANSIAAYMISHLIYSFTSDALLRHLGRGCFEIAGQTYYPLLLGAAILLVQWLILWWMFRRKIFLRV